MMRRDVFVLAAVVLLCSISCKKEAQTVGYPINPVPFTDVKVTDDFWGSRLKAAREVTIPLAFSKCEETGRYENFEKAALQMHSDKNLGFQVGGFSFDDTDVYKTIEGASYVLQTYPDKKLEQYIDSVLVIVAAAQEEDGYLYTARTMNPEHPHNWSGPTRWSTEEILSHELYNLGHMVDGAVAHYQATGKTNFLDIAKRYADCVVREVGPGEGQACVVPGHQIAEMALARLYLATGEKKYLDEAKFLLDMRGRTTIHDVYSQSHKPIVEQDEAVGHAVRATYMYAGIADVAALTGDQAYIDAIDRIWDNIVTKKLYITGGIGATARGEAFDANYVLPNLTSYCETCAAIGNVYVNQRMFLLHGESKYYDVLERTLYNGLISGISLDGGRFFYPNPLESDGSHERQPWFGCACCPSNMCRFLPSIPGYIYATKDNDLYVNLYLSNTLTTKVGGRNLVLSQKSGYPWNGNTEIVFDSPTGKNMTLRLRIPGWSRGEVVPSDLYTFSDSKTASTKVFLNGEPIDGTMEDGYFVISRKFRKGDTISVEFTMEPRVVVANENVEADRGRIAIENGPIVYCAEWVDNDFPVREVVLPENSSFTVEQDPALLGGINKLTTTLSTPSGNKPLTLIPYYAWCNRGPGEMIVWMKNK